MIVRLYNEFDKKYQRFWDLVLSTSNRKERAPCRRINVYYLIVIQEVIRMQKVHRDVLDLKDTYLPS